MSASLELDIDAIETQLKEYEQRSKASSISGNNITLNAKNTVTVQGSNLQANENINIDAKTTDILASKDNHDQSEDTQHKNVNISIGTSGFSMSASADNSESTNVQATHTNSNLQANNININTKETTTIKGIMSPEKQTT
ncbi:hemagglutinin repeat-containing protein [Sulfurimonas sp.]|uniref:hemagglutinin repeat-containing protein n=1 Tax=Sulfurimonas sp. TaxID=2022749 RepID=UPI0025EB5303|nr:hemagglutinin repeat-containing protein [Sulfurimonas sp.]